MRVLSVNVGKPQQREWKGAIVSTGIFKHPVAGEVKVAALDLEGDEQADLMVHGGPDKAVYVYPFEHYAYWRTQLPGETLTMGNFGENLTTEGLSEETMHIGDELEIGTARFVVTQPRLPCYKLGLRFDREEMTRLFYHSRRFGFYLRVLREGKLQTGSSIAVVAEDPNELSVADFIRLFTRESHDMGLLNRTRKIRYLPAGWSEELRSRLG
jgi:MOSC domain-containing protein YiiM